MISALRAMMVGTSSLSRQLPKAVVNQLGIKSIAASNPARCFFDQKSLSTGCEITLHRESGKKIHDLLQFSCSNARVEKVTELVAAHFGVTQRRDIEMLKSL